MKGPAIDIQCGAISLYRPQLLGEITGKGAEIDLRRYIRLSTHYEYVD